MTYCCGILVNDGLVMIADTRTNAGLDNVSTFRKLTVFEHAGQHVMMLASAGNLSVTQSVVNLITEGLENPDTHEIERLETMPSMFDAAMLIGRATRKVRQMNDAAYQHSSMSFDVSFLFGGQIKGRRLRLFMIYSAGISSNAHRTRRSCKSASTNTASRSSTAPLPMTRNCSMR